jgi:hypothetical protein
MRAEASFLPGFSAMGVRRRGSFPRSGSSPIYWPQPSRRDGRVAEGGGLLNRYRVEKLYRGFESLSLRQNCPPLPIPPRQQNQLARSSCTCRALLLVLMWRYAPLIPFDQRRNGLVRILRYFARFLSQLPSPVDCRERYRFFLLLFLSCRRASPGLPHTRNSLRLC